jgi:hypothetical protein
MEALGEIHETVSRHSPKLFAFHLCLSWFLLLYFAFPSFVSVCFAFFSFCLLCLFCLPLSTFSSFVFVSRTHFDIINPTSAFYQAMLSPLHHVPTISFPILTSRVSFAQMRRSSGTGGADSMSRILHCNLTLPTRQRKREEIHQPQ